MVDPTGAVAFLDISPDPAVLIRDGAIADLNAAAADLLGWRREDLLGRPVSTLIRRVGADEWSGTRPDGSALPVSVALRRIGDVTVAVVRDASELAADREARRALQSSLARSETLYRSIVAHLPDVSVMVFDRERVRFVKLANSVTDGSDALAGTAVSQVWSGSDSAEQFAAASEEAFAGRRVDFEFRATYNGRLQAATMVPLFGADGEVDAVMGISVDIEDRRRHERELEEANAVLAVDSTILRSIAEAVLVVHEHDGTVVHATGACEALYGLSADELLGRSVLDVVVSSSRSESVRAALQATGRWSGDLPITRVDGTVRWAAVDVTPFDHPERGRCFVIMHTDITDRRAHEARFRQIFESSPVGMAILDGEMRVAEANGALGAMLGPAPEALVGEVLPVVAADEAVEQRLRTTDGRVAWGRVTSFQIDGPSAGSTIVMVEDVTASKQTQARLGHLATHDQLTGLPNRALFEERAVAALERARQTGSRVAVLFFDLDQFKTVNDSLGHTFGDQLLRVAAARVSDRLRSAELAARLGGAEFVGLIEDLPAGEDEAQRAAAAIARRLSEALAEPMEIGGRSVHMTASIGITIAGGSAKTAEDLLREADTAMYRAKARGRARFELFDEGLRTSTVRRLEMEAALHEALARQELVVHYQPIVNLTSGVVVGAEALVRWRHPERGLLLPAEFLSVAEDAGLIVAVGDLVLHESCRAVASWRRATRRSLFVTVNVSTRQLGLGRLPSEALAALADNRLDPAALELEITENTLLETTGPAATELEHLVDAGVRIGLDDFGTGYGSLSHLQTFRIGFVKIDRSFVADLESSPIAAAVVKLGRSLGVDVIAEGIERADQAARLRELGCGHGQGWLFGHPVGEGEFLDALMAQPDAGRQAAVEPARAE